MPQPQPFGDSATSADPLNGSTGKVVSAQKEYDDAKEDDSFLNEVEDSLLDHPAKTSSRQTLMTRKDENNNDEVNYSTGSETLFSTTNSPSAIAVPVNPFGDDKYSSHSQYGFHHHDSSSSSNASTPPSQLDDPSSFRRKVRAAIFYLLCSTLHEIIIYKISQRTTWSNVTLFIPFELLISTTIAGLVTIYMKKSSNLKLQYAIGLDGSPILPSIAWKDSAPLAGFTVTAAVFRILKDAHLEASISTALSVSRCGTWQICICLNQ